MPHSECHPYCQQPKLSVFVFILGRSATFLGIERVALYRRCPVGPSGTVLPGHQNQVIQGVLWVGGVPFYCDWAAVAVSTVMGSIDLPHSQLRG